MKARRSGRSAHGGFSLIELLVALGVSMLIAMAAVASLTVSRHGFASVDAASQVRDNARFATDLVQRLGVQAGYKDIPYAATPRPANAAGISANPDPMVFGVNNARIQETGSAWEAIARSSGSGSGSDVLVLRYQSPETFPGSGRADESVIDCMGRPAAAVATARDNVMTSILHVADQPGGPALMCTTVDNQGNISNGRPIITGVENLQVLYGVDGVSAGAAPTAFADSIPDSYLRADQLMVPGDPVGTNANWRRVRSLRVGMVIRGPAGSAADRAAQTFYPLGRSMWSSNDDGSKHEPAADGRLRRVVMFTVHLRNAQSL